MKPTPNKICYGYERTVKGRSCYPKMAREEKVKRLFLRHKKVLETEGIRNLQGTSEQSIFCN